MCNTKTCKYYQENNNDGSANADWCNNICDCGKEYIICEDGGCLSCPLTFLMDTLPDVLFNKNRKTNWFYKKRMFLWFKKYFSLNNEEPKFNFKKTYKKSLKLWTIQITIITKNNLGVDDYKCKQIYSIFNYIEKNSGKYWKYLNDNIQIEITNKFKNSEEQGESYFTNPYY